MRIPIYCMTCDKRTWLLKGFYRQWLAYAPELTPIKFVGFGWDTPCMDAMAAVDESPDQRYNLLSLGDFTDYPAAKWSDALIKLLLQTQESHCMIVLEDYFLTRRANIKAIEIAASYAQRYPDILRFDLTTDRLYSGNIIKEVESIEELDIIETGPVSYQISFQAAIWNIHSLLDLLKPGETPWESELNGSYRWQELHASQRNYRVLGFRQWPMKYQIMVRNGVYVPGGDWMAPPRQVNYMDQQILEGMGYK